MMSVSVHITGAIFTTINIIITLSVVHLLDKHCYAYGLQPRAEFTYSLDDGWPMGKQIFGNIAGVDVDANQNVIIFHRGSHVWEFGTFDNNHNYQLAKDSPIAEETVATIDPKQKKIIQAWGRDLFYMPHGLSLDSSGKNLWLTDVALHQVFKYTVDGSKELMVLGTAFVPGQDEFHFCKPTSVADTGEFIFVADGYCNSRIVMFSSQGKYLGEFGQPSEMGLAPSSHQPTFSIPHKITYAKEARMICVADRENGRIQCFTFEANYRRNGNNGEASLILNQAIHAKFTIENPEFNGRMFSIDYSPIRGGIIAAVSGEALCDLPKSQCKPAMGFVYNATTMQIISRFAPTEGQNFGMAHDLAITGDEAGSLYVVDIEPVNLWKFSRPRLQQHSIGNMELTKTVDDASAGAASSANKRDLGAHRYSLFTFILMISVIATILVILAKTTTRILNNKEHASPSNSFSSLYSSNFNPTSLHNIFGATRNGLRRATSNCSGGPFANPTTTFSRRAFFNLFERGQASQKKDFSRIPLEESDNSDDDKSDSDVEEFNINKAASSIKIDV